VDSALIRNTSQSLVSTEINQIHNQSHVESPNTASDQADQAETFENKLQIKKEKQKTKLIQNKMIYNLNINQQVELCDQNQKQKLKEKRLRSKMQRDNLKDILILKEIESFQALDLELKLQKEMLKMKNLKL
jgi:hypothetical protein